MLNVFTDILLPGLILLLCAAGAWLSAQLLRRHDNIWQTSANEDDASLFGMLCRAASLGSGEGCDKAAHGPWSQLPIPLPRPHRDLTISWRVKRVPIAFVGLAWFAATAVWFSLTGMAGDVSQSWHIAFLAAAAISASASIGLIFVMASGRAPWCGGCAVTHGVNLALVSVVAIWFANTSSEPALAGGAYSDIHALRAMAVALMVVVGLHLYRRAHLVTRDQLTRLQPFKSMVDTLQHDDAFLVREWKAQPLVDVPSRQAAVATGPRLVVFTDFQCPGCFCTARQVRDLAIPAFKGRLQVEIRHYPLCTACNDKVDRDLHGEACDAACAAEAARLLGGDATFELMHDLLFMNSKVLGTDTYRRLASQVGLDADELLATMASPTVRDVIRKDVEAADAVGVTGTPAVFLDGRLLPAICRTPRFWQAAARHADALVSLPIAGPSMNRKAG